MVGQLTSGFATAERKNACAEKAQLEYRKFNFEQSFIDIVIDGLRFAGIPERAEASQRGL